MAKLLKRDPDGPKAATGFPLTRDFAGCAWGTSLSSIISANGLRVLRFVSHAGIYKGDAYG